MNWVVILYEDWEYPASKNKSFFSVRIDKLGNKNAALLFQLRETKLKLVSTLCYETSNLNSSIDSVNGVVNESSFVQYIREIQFEKFFIEKPVEYAFVFETNFIC